MIADENGYDVDIYFGQFSWSAYIVLWARDESDDNRHQANAGARKGPRALQAVRPHGLVAEYHGERPFHPNGRR